jgi:hypothetical protein
MPMDWSQYAAGAPQAAPPESAEVVSQSEAKLRQTGYLANGQPAPSAMVVDMNTPPPGGKPAAASVDWSKYAAGIPKAPPTPESNQSTTDTIQESLNQGDTGGLTSTRQVGILGRGALTGLAATADTLGSAIPAAGIIAWIKHEMGMPQDTITAASKKAMDAAGLPIPTDTGERALETTGSVISSTLAGSLLPSGEAPKDAALGAAQYWQKSGVGGSANQRVLGSLLGQRLGLDANTKMTPPALNAVGTQLRSFLDVVRDPGRIIVADPSDIAGQLATLNRKFTPSSSALLEHPVIKDLVDAVDSGHTSAAALGEISSNLGSAASKVQGESYQLSQALRGAQTHVENLVKDGLTPQVQQSYDQARSRYGLFQELKDNTVNAATGEINTPKLVRYFKGIDSKGYSEGQDTSDLYNVLRQSEGMGGNPLAATAAFHTKLLAVARAAASVVPGGAQMAVQQGIPATLRALVNKPGFAAVLQQNLRNPQNDTNNVPNSASATP